MNLFMDRMTFTRPHTDVNSTDAAKPLIVNKLCAWRHNMPHPSPLPVARRPADAT